MVLISSLGTPQPLVVVSGTIIHDYLANRVPRLVVIAVYLFDSLFRNQNSTFLCSVPCLFCMLKNKINGVFSAALIHLKCKGCKGRAVSVMAAFV